MNKYQVIVSNLGTVVDTDNENEAINTYNHFVSMSKDGIGGPSGEDVTLMNDGTIAKEHLGGLNDTV